VTGSVRSLGDAMRRHAAARAAQVMPGGTVTVTFDPGATHMDILPANANGIVRADIIGTDAGGKEMARTDVVRGNVAIH
jgi:hypothetical protein